VDVPEDASGHGRDDDQDRKYSLHGPPYPLILRVCDFGVEAKLAVARYLRTTVDSFGGVTTERILAE
jgi:hypothetical protein